MATLLDEDDLLFEVDFDTETLQQLHDFYEKDRFPSDEKVAELASQAARRMETSEDEGSQVDHGELQRRVREWFSKERSKDAKNGKVRSSFRTPDPSLMLHGHSLSRHQAQCRPSSMHLAMGATSTLTRMARDCQCRPPSETSVLATMASSLRALVALFGLETTRMATQGRPELIALNRRCSLRPKP